MRTLLILTTLFLAGCSDPITWSNAPQQTPADARGQFVAMGTKDYLSLPPRPAGTFFFVENDTGKLAYAIKRSKQTTATDISSKAPKELRNALLDKKTYQVFFRADTN